MTVDYDLVVIGASSAGIAAAKTAARYYARVALIQQGETYNPLPACLKLLQQASVDTQLPGLPQLAQRLELLTLQQQAIDRLDGLASLGIDVIADSGAFYRKPRLGFAVGDRTLTARAYLVAMSLGAVDRADWSFENLPQKLAQLGDVKQLHIHGGSPESVAIAQALVRLGMAVTLVDFGLLSGLDAAIADRLQTQLEADGVRLLMSEPTAVDAGVQLSGITDRPLATNQLGPAGLNLGAAQVRWNREKICVDRDDRATRKVYICSSRSPAQSPQLWEKQAIAATHHALQLPWGQKSPPLPITTVLTNPEAVSIGLTEAQAKRQYGQRLVVLEQPLNQSLKAQAMVSDRPKVIGQTTGFVKLLVRSNGTIVGAHLLGDQATEWAPVLALAMQQGISIGAIGQLAFPTPTLVEVVGQMAIEYRFQSRRSDLWRYGLEEFFAWRRYWVK
jgi:pyruvate/2-oxoglutarate dehydrogenase complex dihydrolipoamide dehydrogenase (E3) component